LIAMVTLSFDVDTTLPVSSRTTTAIAGAIARFTTVVVGWRRKASFLGATVTSKGLLVVPVSPAA